MLFNISLYVVFIVIAYRIYKKQELKPTWWKIPLLFYLGLLSFSINFSFFNKLHQFALLPLGAGLFYLITKNRLETREKYKRFVWLGFFANYAFFIASIAALLLSNLLFPKDELSTYIKSLDNAEVFITHSSMEEPVQLTDDAYDLLAKANPGHMEVDQWYIAQAHVEQTRTEELFPYMLQNVTTPAGLNVEVFFYIEKDSKGLLVLTPTAHYYFRTANAFIEKVGEAQ